jgi:hypothetical protein
MEFSVALLLVANNAGWRWAEIAQEVTATRYGLDGPVIEYGWGWNFPQPSRTALGPTQPPM